MTKITIGELTDKQKSEASDLENKLRALDKLQDNIRTDLQAYSAKAFKKIDDVESEKKNIIELLSMMRTATYD